VAHPVAARNAEGRRGAVRYERHQPEKTLLYQVVEKYYPVFAGHMAAQGSELPGYVICSPTPWGQ